MYIWISIITLLLLWVIWLTIYYSLFLHILSDKGNSYHALEKYEGVNKEGLVGSNSPNIFSTTVGGNKDNSGNIRYDPNNYNAQYHDDVNTIMKSNEGADISFNSYYALDACGNPILITKSMNQANSTYYVPGTYVYGPTKYVPNYEDSIYLSKTTYKPTYTELENTPAMQAGFCAQYENSVADKERTCNSIDINSCASTACCVLLGGNKCVAGDQNGPSIKTNYSDIFIQDPTYYYFQGKCFGNCAAGV